MPEKRLERTRRAYDEGPTMVCAVGARDRPDLWVLKRVPSPPPFLKRAFDVIARNEVVEQLPWRRPSENAAEQLARRSARATPDSGFTANVIEGECFDDTPAERGDPAPGTV